MKINNKTRRLKILYVLMGFLFGYLLITIASPCPFTPYTKTVSDASLVAWTKLPYGVVRIVSPPPESEISFGCYTRKNIYNLYLLKPYLFEVPTVKTVDLLYPVIESELAADGGINAEIELIGPDDFEFIQFFDEFSPHDLKIFNERVQLYVDGRIASQTIFWAPEPGIGAFIFYPSEDAPNRTTYDVGEYIFGSNLFLLPGNHTAKVVIKAKSGEIITEYEWQFRITWW